MINFPQHFKSRHEAVREKDSAADVKLCFYNPIICRISLSKATKAQYLPALGCVSQPYTPGLGMDTSVGDLQVRRSSKILTPGNGKTAGLTFLTKNPHIF